MSCGGTTGSTVMLDGGVVNRDCNSVMARKPRGQEGGAGGGG